MTDCEANSLLASWSASLGATSYTATVMGPHGFTKTCSSLNLTCYVSELQCASHYNITVTSQDDHCTSSAAQTALSTGWDNNILRLLCKLEAFPRLPRHGVTHGLSHRTVRPCECDQLSSVRFQHGHSVLGPCCWGCGLHCVCSTAHENCYLLQEQRNYLSDKPAGMRESLYPDCDRRERHQL